jgi:beta-glucosidase/6-phospho-beta-glucosidase/beta-galactosidase
MRELIDAKSEEEGLSESRLPHFDPGWTLLITGMNGRPFHKTTKVSFNHNILYLLHGSGSWDFLGLNHYTTAYVNATSGGAPGWNGDQNNVKWSDPSWEHSASSWLKVVPWGFREVLKWINNTYGNPILYVTENGFSDTDSVGLNDTRRVNYFTQYINNMLKAVLLDGCNVVSYTAW